MKPKGVEIVLETRQLSVNYGGVRALSRVDMAVPRGHLVGLIGPNGAGKTTLIDALTGFVECTGKALLNGVDIGQFAPHERAKAGLVRTWQAASLFEDLSLEDNVRVALEHGRVRDVLLDLIYPARKADGPAVREILSRLGLSHKAAALPNELSYGERKLGGVARALASGGDVVLLDEPAAGLDNRESEELGRRLTSLVSDGVTLLLVDHDMSLVLGVCDWVYVLNFGEIIASGTPAQVRANERVIDSYLGAAGRGSRAGLGGQASGS